jgi:hypothetical protein
LYGRLSAHFAESDIFMDVDKSSPGETFLGAIEKNVDSCGVLVERLSETVVVPEQRLNTTT